MTGADVLILLVLLGSTAIGLLRGFVREAASLVFWIIAIWAAFMLAWFMVTKYLKSSDLDFKIYRFVQENGVNTWLITNDTRSHSIELDRDVFDRLLLSLFQ